MNSVCCSVCCFICLLVASFVPSLLCLFMHLLCATFSAPMPALTLMLKTRTPAPMLTLTRMFIHSFVLSLLPSCSFLFMS